MIHFLAGQTNNGQVSDFTSHHGIMLGLVALAVVIVLAFVFRRRG